jgi:hypothetical protein
MLKLLAVAAVLICTNLQAEAATAASGKFKTEATQDGTNLKYTGESSRKKFFVKVYNVASYVQDGVFKGGNKFDEILQDNNGIKRLDIKWVHEASKDKVKEGWEESFKSHLSDQQYAALQPDIQKFVGFLTAEDTKVGDEQVFTWLANGSVGVQLNGKNLGTIDNKDFGKALWTLYFGPKSVVDRDKLLQDVK